MSWRRALPALLVLAATLHCGEVLGQDPPEPASPTPPASAAGGEQDIRPLPPGQACTDALAATGAAFTPIDPGDDEPAPFAGCGLTDGVSVSRGPAGITYRPAIRVSCAYALALGAVERTVQSVAMETLGEPIEVIRTMGSYGCRTIQSTRSPGRLSEHAVGNAVDVGEWWSHSKRAVVVRDFRAQTPEGEFLRALAVRLRESGALERLLDPDYDAAHRNHFHLEGHPLD
jgi:hypothetical protein